MKLLKKLLPVAAIASTAAIVAPIVTSCGGQYSWRITKDNYETGYESVFKTEDLPTGELDTADATKTYFGYVKENKQVFADDLLLSFVQKGKLESIKQINEKLSASIGDIDPETGKVTVKMVWDQNRTLIDEKTESEVKGKLIIELKSVPFVVRHNGTDWTISLDKTFKPAEDDKWSALISVDGTRKVTEDGKTTTYVTKYSQYGAGADASVLREISYLDAIPSNYLSQRTPK